MMAMSQRHDVVVYNRDGQCTPNKQKRQQGTFVAAKHIISVNPAAISNHKA